MNDCQQCGDKGVIRIRYEDGSLDDFAICVCRTGRWMRSTTNGVGRHSDVLNWKLWAAVNHVDPEHIGLAEEFLEPEEIAMRFPDLSTERQPTSSVDTIADAMRTQPRPRL